VLAQFDEEPRGEMDLAWRSAYALLELRKRIPEILNTA